MRILPLALLFASVSLPALSEGVGGPVVGFVADEAAAGVRPILGVPGAAMLGEALALGLDVQRMAVSQASGYALGVEVESRQIAIVRFGVEPARTVLENARPDAVRIALSPSGGAAILFYDDNTMQAVSGLPGSPRVHRATSLNGLPSAAALAVSDRGEMAVVGSETGGDSLYLVRPDGRLRHVLSAGRIPAAGFFRGASDVAYVDGVTRTVYVMRSDTSAPYPVGGPQDGLESAVGLAVSADSKSIAVAGANGALRVIDVSAGSTHETACDCEPARLEGLNGRALFRVHRTGEGPVLLLDASGPELRVLFVPAIEGGRP